MIRNFSFNSDTHNYWEIYESIVKFYPIGLEQYEGRGIYYEYPGIKKLTEIVVENIHNIKNYRSRWTSFVKEMSKDLKKRKVGTTYGQAPSFSSFLILEKNEIKNIQHQKELHFSVSLVGNFYQIYGIDRTIVLEEDKEKKYYSRNNVITTSPFKEFKETFENVEIKLKERFPDYRLVPFEIGQTKINGLCVGYLDKSDCTINQALFNDFLSGENISIFKRGNRFYGENEWLKS